MNILFILYLSSDLKNSNIGKGAPARLPPNTIIKSFDAGLKSVSILTFKSSKLVSDNGFSKQKEIEQN